MAAVFLVVIPSSEYEKKLDSGICKDADDESTKLIPIKPSFPSILNSSQLEEVKVIGVNNESAKVASNKEYAKDNNNKCMKQELEIGLKNLKIEGSTWTKSLDGNYYQVVFPCESQERCQDILDEFYHNGIGRFKESSVSLVPCAVFNKGGEENELEITDKEINVEQNKQEKSIDSWKKAFLKSIKARLTVAQVVDDVRAGTLITFDFVAFLVLASLIAGFGLMDSSSVSIVASMLVSPLMGPIMALSFSVVVNDRKLFKLGIKAELLGLCICISSGLILGLINAPWATGWGKGPWPNPEMFGRGQVRALWVGMLVALPSGAGVALSILGGNVSALVGVAISASLLPPCVNAGILWGNAIVLAFKAIAEDQVQSMIYNNQNLTEKPALFPSEDYVVQYSTNMSLESGALGAISLCLALVNIASIILMAIIVFKIKEVAPPGSMPSMSRFWKEDIKITRDYNRTVHKDDSGDLEQRFQKEWTDFVNHNNSSAIANHAAGERDLMAEFADIVQEAEEDEVYLTVRQLTNPHKIGSPTRNQLTWIPETGVTKPPPVWEAFRGSSRRSYMSTRRPNFTLVEARNRRCTVSGRKLSKSLSTGAKADENDDLGASRFQVTKVVSREPSMQRPHKSYSVKASSKKY